MQANLITPKLRQTGWIDWLPEASRTTNQSSPAIDCRGFRAIAVRIQITSYTAGSLTAKLMEVDTAYFLAAGSALSAASLKFVVFGAEVTSVATGGIVEIKGSLLPDSCRINIGVADATPITYSAKYQLIP